jgi:hypothetical protein
MSRITEPQPRPRSPLATPRGSFRPLVTLGLALLAAPRVLLHDLDIVQEGALVNLVLVFGPPAVWVWAAVATRIPHPLRALAWVGAAYGVVLAVTHQLLWDRAFGDDPPRLGGNLEGELSAANEELVLRGFACGSSLVTGLAVGAISGLVALWLTRPGGPRPRDPR